MSRSADVDFIVDRDLAWSAHKMGCDQGLAWLKSMYAEGKLTLERFDHAVEVFLVLEEGDK